MKPECPFCDPDSDRTFYDGLLVRGLWDGFPVSPGHALLMPKRHVPSWFEASKEEQIELFEAIDFAKSIIDQQHQPDGYNIGVNVQEAAGQTVFHLHVHLIPRYRGDVADPLGGVRHVIPHKANYLLAHAQTLAAGALPPLVRGDDDPLLPRLLDDLDEARSVDLAVAFVFPSGVQLILEHLRDCLDRAGKVRILTGDYLDLTDPQALLQLLDLEGNLELRVFETKNVTFHPKAYIFQNRDGSGRAYVGSSNLTLSALRQGIEWNYRVDSHSNEQGFRVIQQAYDQIFQHPSTCPVDHHWIDAYRRRRQVRPSVPAIDVKMEPPEPPPAPHPIQEEVLRALEETRKEGNMAGLVVLATGLGKTWLSAFDSNRSEYQRVLFVAHREEILGQALGTFRRIRPFDRLGLYTGKEKTPAADVVFASIQTLGKKKHLQEFAPDHFDYIVVDEFHHAAAKTYRNLIRYFNPRFLLGLTATPERTDGGNLLSLCNENLVFRCDFIEGIRRDLLCPFKYLGVPDEVDYQNIPWRSSRFDEEALTQAVATQKRAQNALEQYREHGGKRTLAFCCSVRHADFMADFFGKQGISAVAVHSGLSSAPRAASLERLNEGELEILCTVDIFNEGVDLPQVDTILMLRPTESNVLWTQQFGRGLRKAEGKKHLKVIDYIGNHRIFLVKIQSMMSALTQAFMGGDQHIAYALEHLRKGETELPEGCEVTYELEAVDIIKRLLREPSKKDALVLFYQDFRDRHGARPNAAELFHEGYSLRSLQKGYGSWFGFVQQMGDLGPLESQVLRRHHDFLAQLEKTPMTKSYKMLLLTSMLNLDGLPGSVSMDELVRDVRRVSWRSAQLREDVGSALDDDEELQKLLENNPIDAWVGGKGTGGQGYFTYDREEFGTRFDEDLEKRDTLQEMVREIVDWRMAEYLARSETKLDDGEWMCKVSHSGGSPILFLPERRDRPDLPTGWTPILVDGQECQANFVKVALNVVRKEGSGTNVLPGVLRGWFGTDAGLPGTRHQVKLSLREGEYSLEPLGRHSPDSQALELWRSYAREQIPRMCGLEFSTGVWNQGFVVRPNLVFLLVTLEKGDLIEEHRYEDRFLSADEFQWQSQNRTSQESKHGQLICHHKEKDHKVHLYVRRWKKSGNRAAPFVYCGELEFQDWEGEKPITVQWKLQNPVPKNLNEFLQVPEVPDGK